MKADNVGSGVGKSKWPHVEFWRWGVAAGWLVAAVLLWWLAVTGTYIHLCLLLSFAAFGAGLGTPLGQGISGAVVATVVCGLLYLAWMLFGA